MKRIYAILSALVISASLWAASYATWNILQTTDSLHEGVQVFFGNPVKDYVMGLYDYDVAKSNIRGAAAVYGNQRHTVTASIDNAYTVHRDGDKLYFEDTSGRYLYMYNTNKNLSASTSLDNQAKWTVSIANDKATIKSVYSTSWTIYFNKTAANPMYCTYQSADANMADVVLYASNAPEWAEPVRVPKLTILAGKDTITDTLDFGDVVYDDSWGTETNPYEQAKTLTFITENVDSIFLLLSKGNEFKIGYDDVADTIKATGKNDRSIQFSTDTKGSYSDTLYITCDTIVRKIVLLAKAVTEEEIKPAITLSTRQVYLNPNYQNGCSDIAMFTFTTTNMVKNLYIKWENTPGNSIPSYQGESAEVLAESEYVIYGSSTNMGAVDYTDAEVLIAATAYTPGTYTSTLLFYTPDANDKSKNAFEERVTITIEASVDPVPTDWENHFRDVSSPRILKQIKNNQLLIYSNGRWHNALGQTK